MSCLFIRGDLLARIGLLHALVGVLSSAGCYRAFRPAHQIATADRPTVRSGQPTSDEELRRGFPGVVVARTANGGVSIHLLGATVGSGPPLYVIDGTPVLADPSRGFDWLKPEDIVHVRVLRGPAETVVHGPRGVHGVVLVTTRQSARRRK
jgi:outer membrane receptor for ferrienterochelin and colicin